MPAFKIFLHAFCGSDDLAIPVCRYADSNKDGHVLHFAAPAAFQVNTVNINVCVFTGQFSAAPGFDVFVSLLVEVTDRSWRYLGTLNIPWSKDRDSGRTVPRIRDRGTVLPSNDTTVISDRMRCHEFTHIQLSGIDSHRVMNDPVQDGVSNDTATEARMPFTGFVL